MPRTDESIRAYLLGLLPEADAEALEEAYFADPEALDHVRAVEDDLLDDYAAGRLGPADRIAFEGRYSASEPLRQRVIAARALRTASSSIAARPSRAGAVLRWAVPLAVAAVFLVAVVGPGLLGVRKDHGTSPGPGPTLAQGPSPTPSDTPTASPSAQVSPSATPIAPATTRLVFALSPTLLRGEGGPALVRFPPRTDAVVLELQGDPAAVPRGARLAVAIETVEGAAAWSGPAQRGPAPAVASAVVPAARLAPGDYLATLSAGDQVLHRYFFRVPAR
jgi:hypothetical protein